MGSHSRFFNYTIIDDDVCELDENASYFEIRLSILSTADNGLILNSNLSVAGVTIDDSTDEECCECPGMLKCFFAYHLSTLVLSVCSCCS